MKPSIAQKYRTQAINLQPYGNTISVEAGSDNPYESDQDVEIFTQASGGMAGPDTRMRSRGLLIQRPRSRAHVGGKVKTFRLTQDAAHSGFFPGMGALEARRGGFVPGLGGAAEDAAAAINAAVKTTGDVLSQREARRLAAAEAGRSEAAAREEGARANRMDAEARLRAGAANLGKHKTLVVGLGIAAAAAIGIAIFLKRK